jgi:GTP:adenosylcobinamide-phosphate guanylyltransferase
VLKRLVSLPEFSQQEKEKKLVPSCSVHDNKGQLKVRVFSFSYKKGIPADTSGNGGGYVFDCRATHNPGRYEPYKKLTGLDQPVIDFLENDGEIITFLDNIYKLADAHVERYMERGFTSLMFSFGCTGGQHRSVYSAQHLAEHINEKYGIEVSITHREQNIVKVLPARRKAMIFAAGLGTRLKPLTDTRPKALVEIAGKPLIEHVLQKLVSAGFNDIVVNVHHFADMIEEWGRNIVETPYYKDKNIRISFSDERHELLETGGGILHAAALLTNNNPEHKFLVHNVDILSNLNLDEFWAKSHGSADAVLVVSKRKTARYLVFDDEMNLVGWTNISTGEIKSPYEEVHEQLSQRPQDALDFRNYHLRAFSGIHIISIKLIDTMLSWPTKFSITDFYLAQCKDSIIKGHEQHDLKLMDVGKINCIQDAEQFVF